MFKVNNRNTRRRCGICSKLTIKKPERRVSSVTVADFEQVNVYWNVFKAVSYTNDINYFK